MEKVTVREGYQTVMPYLIVPRAAQFMDFLRKVFQAEEKYRTDREDGQIMHAEMTIGGSTIMLAEATGEWAAQPAGLYIHVANADEAYHQALAEGATPVMELADQPYGRSGGVKDPFGNTWWVTSAL
ncbi:glyoxalase/bleomycin resistance/extradiol dioxygenase family protein [Rufibacter sp. XAAS-G3-1]|uniref:VOC family protein n=1 Tax=Rufibacter sp. XAAS-G3-1 TaxID=2729134 RepID=UPI0015E71D90|nr:VOC family protein [Rufibacter sp. XAAS-G3-1]